MSAPWPSRSLVEVCEIKPPKSESKRKLRDSDSVSFVPMEDLGIDQKFLEPKAERKLGEVAGSYTYFADGDVLLAKITPCFENGKLGIARGLTNGIGFGSSEYIVFRPSNDLISEYLYYFLSQDSFRADGIRTMSGAVGHKRVSKEFIESCQIPLPPLPEQKRIVAILDEAFVGLATATANAEKNLKNARELFESYLSSNFIEGVAGNWGTKALSELTEIDTPITYGVVKPGAEGEVKFVRGGDLSDGEVLVDQLRTITRTVSDQYRRTLLRGGELLICLVGQPGQVGIAPPTLAGANIARQVGLVRLRSEYDTGFVCYFLRSRIGQKSLGAYQGGSVQQVINLADLRLVKVPLPDFGTQKDIVGRLDEVSRHSYSLESVYRRKVHRLAELKQSILQKAFSGELTSPPVQAIKEAAE